uniref:Uncharacterized protein n=1 Tax=Avena sativa TaxID=4498 RepID=A0ACD5W4P5_AVESA
MQGICASAGSSSQQHGDCSAGSSSHQHGDCASAGSSSQKHGDCASAGSSSDRPYPRWTGARFRSSRSLPGRLSEIMAPLKWPEPMLDYFVDECFKMVQDGKSPANETSFFQTLDRSMARKSLDITFCTEDLIQQFRGVRSLWDKYHEILKNLEIKKVQERQSQTDPDKLRLKTGDIYASKFILIRKYEIKLNTIFESFYGSKAKSLSTYRFNIEHSDRYSGDNSISSKRRSLELGEWLPRAILRQAWATRQQAMRQKKSKKRSRKESMAENAKIIELSSTLKSA